MNKLQKLPILFLLLNIVSIGSALAIGTPGPLDADQIKKGIENPVKTEVPVPDHTCEPLYCECLPPKAPNGNSCTSRVPSKPCQRYGDKEIDCETYCGSDVGNCNPHVTD